MSDRVPSDDRPLVDVPPPSQSTQQTELPSGALMDMNEAEINQLLGSPPNLPQQTQSVLLTPASPPEAGQSTSTTGETKKRRLSLKTDTDQPNKQSKQTSTPTTSQPSITPPVTPHTAPTTPSTSPLSGYGQSSSTSDPLDSLSGELDVSSDNEASGGLTTSLRALLSGRESKEITTDTRNQCRQRTERDLNKLRHRGLDIQLTKEGYLGHGYCNTVYRGTFTSEIQNIKGKAAKYLAGVQPGQPFAAKYYQFISHLQNKDRLAHEIEKQCLKRLANHPNIVSYKLSINLGAKRILQNVITGRESFTCCDRIFLIMDMADLGHLEKFMNDKKLNDKYALDFMSQMFNGMSYMHQTGVIHNDLKPSNILLFSGQYSGDIVVKYADFGIATLRGHWSSADVTDEKWAKAMQLDIKSLGFGLKHMLRTAQSCPTNQGLDLKVMQDLIDQLAKDPDKPLYQVTFDV